MDSQRLKNYICIYHGFTSSPATGHNPLLCSKTSLDHSQAVPTSNLWPCAVRKHRGKGLRDLVMLDRTEDKGGGGMKNLKAVSCWRLEAKSICKAASILFAVMIPGMGRCEMRIIPVKHRSRMSTLCLPNVITCNQISQAFPFNICILQVIKDQRWEWLRNEATQKQRFYPSFWKVSLPLQIRYAFSSLSWRVWPQIYSISVTLYWSQLAEIGRARMRN